MVRWYYGPRGAHDILLSCLLVVKERDVARLDRKVKGWGLRRTTDPTVDIKGPLGLQLLHLSSEPLVDFIFVHGLGGGSIKTWRKGTADAALFWPQNWLPLDPAFKNVSVHTFGYNADWADTKESVLNVHDFGRALLGEMKISPHLRSHEGNPIVLIGHSMGGLVIKKAYILARQDLNSQGFARRIQTIFFLATPHRGSDSAPLLNNILKSSGVLSGRQYIADLQKNSVTTQIINDEFRNYADELGLWSFYETLKTSLGISSTMIVEKDSAVLGFKHEKVQYLNASHRGVCKYGSPTDPNYITLKNALATAVEELLKAGNVSKSEKSRLEIRSLQAYLDVFERPDADFAIQEDVKIAGTCEWLEEREDFLKWRDVFDDPLSDMNHSSRCYWVSAKPATGKSVLAGHTVKCLEDSKLDCSYYFFHYGNKSSQVLSGLLRSLAYQMALSNSIMRQVLLDLLADGIHLDKDDERAIWRKVFLNGIFMAKTQRPQYWVIDALDECINYTSLLPLLSKMESAFPLRVFITSRKNPDIEKQFNRFGHDVIATQISIDDTNRDIALFLRSKTKSLPADTPSEREELANQIMLKSGGCFLWVRLVVQVLEKTYGDKKIQSVLEAMPAEMGLFYEQTVNIMSNTIMEKNIAQSILRWAVCSTRPLKAEELQAALQLDIGESVRSIKSSVEGLCGQLVYVDKNGAVQMVHQTAREFLLNNKSSEFRIEIGLEHERMALACLNFLCSDELKPPRNRRLLGTQRLDPSVLCDYACTAFSEHILGANSEADIILVSLNRFLHTNVLTWIELIARKRSLYYLTRTAKNLKGYLSKRTKYLSPLGGQAAAVDAWATNLIRLVAKFGATMISDPTSIYFLIPPLCPQNSPIYTQFAKSSDGLALTGISNENWEDCISCIDFSSSRATALACGENVFAIGMRSGVITLYNHTTFQVERVFLHMEPVKCLKFDSSCKRFASCGWKHIKLWDRCGSQVWNQSLKTPCIAIAFDAKHLVGVSKNSHVTFWDLKDGTVMHDRFYPYREPDDEDGTTAQRAPLTAAFSPNLEILALGYRSCFVCLWDLQNQDFIGCCSRSIGTEKFGLAVGTVLFNPNPEKNLLAIGYQDGDLAIFDPWSRELIKVVEGNALSLASSPDGRTLATGDSCGMVQLWDFETLTLLYRIKSFDFEVKGIDFSGDGLRLIDIRDSRSKIWEPAVLIRKTIEEDVRVSDATALPAITVGLDYFNEILNITTLVSHPTISVIFAGKSNGDVAVFDAMSGKEKAVLYSHPKGVFITAITCSKNNILVSADAGSNVQVWKLSRTPAGVWHTQSQILTTVPKQHVKQLLLSPEGDYVLISAAASASVWSTKTGLLVGTSEFVATERTIWKWFSIHLPNLELLLVVDNRIKRHSWSSFPSSLSPSTLRISYDEKLKSEEIEIQDAILDARSHHLIIDYRRHYGNKSTTTLLIFDFLTLLTAETTIVPNRGFSALAKQVKYFIGDSPKRMVFVDNESWLSSVDLTAAKCTQYARHFFVPHEFVAGNTGVAAVLTATGDVAFTKEGQLAVMRNGMKFQNIIEFA